MAGQAEVGSLRVRLSMDAGEFDRGTKSAENSLGKFAAKLASVAKTAGISAAAIGAAFIAAGGALAFALKGTIDKMDEISKLSSKIGIPTEQLSALSHAADLANVSIEQLGNGVKKLSVNMADVAGGDTGNAAKAFTALGVSVTDAAGQLKNAETVIIELADKFAGMEDGAGKTALAVQLFGKSGAELIPLLNEGGQGLKAMTDEARDLGITFDARTGKAAEQFNDNITRINAVFQGFVTRIAAAVLPTLVTLTDGFLNFLKTSGAVDTAIQIVTNTFKGLVTVGVVIKSVFDLLIITFQSVTNAIINLVNLDFSATLESLKVGIGDITSTVTGAISSINSIWTQTGETIAQTAVEIPKNVAPIVQATKGISDAQKELNKLMEEGKRLKEEMRTVDEELIDRQNRINLLFQKGAIDVETYGRAMARAATFSTDNMFALGKQVTSTLGKIFGESKAVAIATAIVNTAEAVTKTLAQYPYPINIAMAALTAAAGAAEIATIKSTNKNSSSGGGSGGGGSAAVPTTPAAATQQQSFTIDLHGESFSREAVRGLIEQINSAIADGAVLRVISH